ncbi:MAG: hypothetical protein AABZ32_11765, partial [Bacteroidota bacterium]
MKVEIRKHNPIIISVIKPESRQNGMKQEKWLKRKPLIPSIRLKRKWLLKRNKGKRINNECYCSGSSLRGRFARSNLT